MRRDLRRWVVFGATCFGCACFGCACFGCASEPATEAGGGDAAGEVQADDVAEQPDLSAGADAEEGAEDAPLGAGAALGCNGHEGLCSRRFDEVAFAATHNAMSNADDGWLLPNQQHPIAQQLEDGVRALLLDTYEFSGEAALCHAICEAGSKPLVEALIELREFLDEHPREVVALLLEDHLDVDQTAAAFEAAELLDDVYAPSAPGAWPTLGEMVESGERLVVFTENGGPPPAWYLHLWEHAFDTPYSFSSVEDFSCEIHRGEAGNSLFLLNHWLSDPVSLPEYALLANSFGVLYDRAIQCWQERDHIPNFIAVDFYAEGDLFAVVDALNRVHAE